MEVPLYINRVVINSPWLSAVMEITITQTWSIQQECLKCLHHVVGSVPEYSMILLEQLYQYMRDKPRILVSYK